VQLQALKQRGNGLSHTNSLFCTLTPHMCYTWGCAVVAQVDAIVYLVDAADRERFPESQRELAGLLSDDGLAGVPFLVLGNKIDLPYAGGCADCPTVAADSRASTKPLHAQLLWRAASKST
jgi:hypothetical protein